jgi:hypothetical protein
VRISDPPESMVSAKKFSLIDPFLPFGDRFEYMTQAGVDLPGKAGKGFGGNT